MPSEPGAIVTSSMSLARTPARCRVTNVRCLFLWFGETRETTPLWPIESLFKISVHESVKKWITDCVQECQPSCNGLDNGWVCVV